MNKNKIKTKTREIMNINEFIQLKEEVKELENIFSDLADLNPEINDYDN